ncbi:hypothetical protein GE061_013151 [Apolygus lucorum]|uniref:Uncharacterized protein n=1 Tax=Apolygus lucorum TaxID=248454 RepID=A0A8S9XYE9_APOLU|nr:hypothetical protein GE061_013151 [Apolygus lucorum]
MKKVPLLIRPDRREATVALCRGVADIRKEPGVARVGSTVVEPRLDVATVELGMDVPVIGPGAGVPQLVPHVEVPVAEPDTEAPQLVPHVEVPVAGPGTKVQQLVPHLEVPEVGPGMDVPIDEPRMEMPIIERRAEVSTAKLRMNMADADRRTNGSIELEIEGTVESVGYPVTRLPIGGFRRIGAVLGDDPGDAVGDAEEMPMERWDQERPDTRTELATKLQHLDKGQRSRVGEILHGFGELINVPIPHKVNCEERRGDNGRGNQGAGAPRYNAICI